MYTCVDSSIPASASMEVAALRLDNNRGQRGGTRARVLDVGTRLQEFAEKLCCFKLGKRWRWVTQGVRNCVIDSELAPNQKVWTYELHAWKNETAAFAQGASALCQITCVADKILKPPSYLNSSDPQGGKIMAMLEVSSPKNECEEEPTKKLEKLNRKNKTQDIRQHK